MRSRKKSHGCLGSLIRLIFFPIGLVIRLISFPFRIVIRLFCNLFHPLFRGNLTAGKQVPECERGKVWIEVYSGVSGERNSYRATGPWVRRHFELCDRIENAWRKGNRPDIISLCQAQIDIAKDVHAVFLEQARLEGSLEFANEIGHSGFHRLAMLREKECNFAEAIRICEEGIAIGWAQTDLRNRAKRCAKKLAKMGR